MGIVYCIINLVNLKMYVGRTSKGLKSRWKEHSYPYLCTPAAKGLLQRAIHKYKKENFIAIELERCETRKQLGEREMFWIEALQTNVHRHRGFGYNKNDGGLGGGDQNLSKETLQKLADLCRIRMTGRNLTSKHKLNISRTAKGKLKSPETRRKMGENRPKKPVFQFDIATKRIRYFKSTQHAENFVKTNGFPKGGKNGILDSVKFKVVRYNSYWFRITRFSLFQLEQNKNLFMFFDVRGLPSKRLFRSRWGLRKASRGLVDTL